MKEIPLTRGKVAIVDDEDFERLSKWKWHAMKNSGSGIWYAARAVPAGTLKPWQTRLRMHREILGAAGKDVVDHRNGDGLDNRRENLRLCSQSQNRMNSIRSRRSRSRFKGVVAHAKTGRWRAVLTVDGRRTWLGWFDSDEEAARVYDAEARRVYGEFAALNFPVNGERAATP